MKIVIVGTASPLRGGIAHFVSLLYTHLSVRHDVEVVTFSRQYPSFLFPGKSQEEQGDDAHAIPTEQLVDSVNPLTWYAAARAIIRKKPDLLIFKYWLPFFGPCFGTIARLVKRATHARVLFICDNIIPHEHRPGDRLFTRYAFGPVDHFIVQSAAVERELKAFLPGADFAFVPHPVYEIFGAAMPKEEARRRLELGAERVILFFGYVRKYKGLQTLLDAMPAILRQKPVTLLAVGEFYDSEQPYREKIAQLGIDGSVRVHSDYVPNDAVATYFSAADVVVLPYLSATQSGIVQIAYQFDKPVIATDVGGLAEVVRDGMTGFIVPPNAPEALAQAVIRFYDEAKEEPFVQAVREEKKKYSWDALVQAIERFRGAGTGRTEQSREDR